MCTYCQIACRGGVSPSKFTLLGAISAPNCPNPKVEIGRGDLFPDTGVFCPLDITLFALTCHN